MVTMQWYNLVTNCSRASDAGYMFVVRENQAKPSQMRCKQVTGTAAARELEIERNYDLYLSLQI